MQQRTVEQIVNVLVPQIVEIVVEVPEVQKQERIMKRPFEQIVEIPRPQLGQHFEQMSKGRSKSSNDLAYD